MVSRDNCLDYLLIITDNYDMAIERLSFYDGLLIDNPDEISSFIGRTVMEHADDLVALEPGEYDIAPPIWRGNRGSYKLYVFPDGEASSLSHPVSRNASLVRIYEDQVEVTRLPQTQIQDIKASNNHLIITGTKNAKIDIFLYELIFYHR